MYVFPDPLEADPDGQGLICIGGDLEASTLFEAYTHGLFPWFNEGDPICWWCPEPRCVIFPHEFKPSKSLLRNMKKMDYQIRFNHAFEKVVRSCALPRNYTNETWISEDIVQGYVELFREGYAYSVEVWEQDQLIGGLYGVNIGRGCFGESMFSHKTDASKMAFYSLMLLGLEQQLPWIDCQLENDHLLRLGARTISRQSYLKSLQGVIIQPIIDWKKYQERVFSTHAIAKDAKLTG